MNIYGELDLGGNLLKNGRFEHLEDFPQNPKVGTWSFIQKQLMVCVELEDLPVWVPLTPERNTYLHKQPIPSTEWNIPHLLDQDNVMIQCFDGGNKVVIPDSIETVDKNVTRILFSDPVMGSAIVMFGYTEGAHVDGKFKGGASDMPIGSVFRLYRNSSIPENCMVVRGQTLSSEVYPDFVKEFGGEGAKEVTLDDARGLFVRNLDLSKGKDVDREEGSVQNQEIQSHDHPAYVNSTNLGTKYSNTTGHHGHNLAKGSKTAIDHYHMLGTGGNAVAGTNVGSKDLRSGSASGLVDGAGSHNHSVVLGSHGHTVVVQARGGLETRPENIAYVLVVKVK